MAAVSDFIRGDSRDVVITFREDDGTTPLDLNGATVFLTLNASPNPVNDNSAVLQKIVTSHSNPDQGITTITLDSSDTNTIKPGVYYYDIQAVDAGGNVLSQKKDTWEIIPDITRRTS